MSNSRTDVSYRTLPYLGTAAKTERWETDVPINYKKVGLECRKWAQLVASQPIRHASFGRAGICRFSVVIRGWRAKAAVAGRRDRT